MYFTNLFDPCTLTKIFVRVSLGGKLINKTWFILGKSVYYVVFSPLDMKCHSLRLFVIKSYEIGINMDKWSLKDFLSPPFLIRVFSPGHPVQTDTRILVTQLSHYVLMKEAEHQDLRLLLVTRVLR